MYANYSNVLCSARISLYSRHLMMSHLDLFNSISSLFQMVHFFLYFFTLLYVLCVTEYNINVISFLESLCNIKYLKKYLIFTAYQMDLESHLFGPVLEYKYFRTS